MTLPEDDKLNEPKKRNCGRSGPTSAAGRARSAMNAIKHGSCAFTLILPTESEEGLNLLLDRWTQRFNPTGDPLTQDFVLKVVQAEWHRIRCQGNYDEFLCTTSGANPFNWSDEQKKNHDLQLRYKTTAERSFNSQFTQLRHFLKASQPDSPPAPPTPPTEPPRVRFITKSSTSPTGYIALREHPVREGVEYPCPTDPPPNPMPDPNTG